MTLEKKILELKLRYDVAFHIGQLDVVQIVDRFQGFNQPVVGDVVMHGEDGLLWEVGESGLGSRRQGSLDVELQLGIHDGPEVALLRHLAVFVHTVQVDADLRVQNVLENLKKKFKFLNSAT